MSQEQKRVSAREFKEKVELGWKRPALMEYFGIPNTRVTEYLQQLDLRIKSTRGGGSILVLDLEEETNSNQLEIPFEAAVEITEEIFSPNQSISDTITIEGDLSQENPFEEAFEESSEIQTVNSL